MLVFEILQYLWFDYSSLLYKRLWKNINIVLNYFDVFNFRNRTVFDLFDLIRVLFKFGHNVSYAIWIILIDMCDLKFISFEIDKAYFLYTEMPVLSQDNCFQFVLIGFLFVLNFARSLVFLWLYLIRYKYPFSDWMNVIKECFI